MDLDKKAKDILDKVQNQWWSTATCNRTKDIDDNSETKTEKKIGTCVTPRLITKESNWKANEKKNKPDRPREMLLDWFDENDYKWVICR